jgi:SAM-dependent methyltransferase
MTDVEGARAFQTDGGSYDAFMGRYSSQLATLFADSANVVSGQSALDVGCGPGALTSELVARLGAASVAACDPSPPFVEACASRHPGVEVKAGQAEWLPFADSRFDHSMAQLVIHFITDPPTAVDEMTRVVVPGGGVSACTWEDGPSMEMFGLFWGAARAVDSEIPEGAGRIRFGRSGEIVSLFEQCGLLDVAESRLRVSAEYGDFEEYWRGFGPGMGSIGAYFNSITPELRSAIRDEMFAGLGSPSGAFALSAVAVSATGRVPA